MDILAHVLWAGAGVALIRRRRTMTTTTAVVTIALAAMPDIGHMLPLLGWSLFGDGSLANLWLYAIASPGQEPVVPPMIAMFSHHLHCTLHSAIVAGVITLLLWLALRSLWVPLLGWWSHIVIDVFTHSADFYPSPVLYPITQNGFDGIAWNTPWFMVLNYVMLACTGLCLLKKPKG